MREILFRGKRRDNGDWVEGYVIKWDNGTTTIDDGTLETPSYVVEPATVGQYTGLLDKNGKRIFEGDILQCAMFEYSKNRAAVMAERYNCGCCHLVYGFSTCSDDVDIGRKSKIVGNIHDNPDLLEGNT